MTVPLILEIKKLLSDILVSEKIELRKKGMMDVMELMEELEMDSTKIEEFLEINNIKKGNEIVEGLLNEVNKMEYASDKKMREMNKTHFDSNKE